MKLHFHGAARMVTGSNYLLETAENKILVDCGLFQGFSEIERKNLAPFPYNPKEIDFVLRSEGIFGIEIKFRKKIEKIHQISQVKNYIILTKNLIEHREGNEIYIPVFLFLPLLKNKEGYL